MTARKSWATILDEAEVRGSFTQYQKKAVSHWNTCAVGERANYPKEEHQANPYYIFTGESEHQHKLAGKLFDLGFEFMESVKADDVEEARRVYALIQEIPL